MNLQVPVMGGYEASRQMRDSRKGSIGTDPGLNGQRGGGSSGAASISRGGRIPG